VALEAGGGAATDRHHVRFGEYRQAVQRTEGRIALRHGPEQHIAVGRHGGQQRPRLLVQAEPAPHDSGSQNGQAAQHHLLQ
jgi:hypothetical protein